MATTRLAGRYALVYLVYNTIFNLLTQDEQVACFENAAHHLADDAVFVVVLDVCHYDPVTQLLRENHVRLSAAGIRFGPIVCRLSWPSEMDLMAQIAGLRLVERWVAGSGSRSPAPANDT